jgi:hypothetical protein
MVRGNRRRAAAAFADAFVTVFKFSSTSFPAVCPSCPHRLVDHIYIGEFTTAVLPGGIIGVTPTHGRIVCSESCDCAGTWNLSVLDSVDTILISPGNGDG